MYLSHTAAPSALSGASIFGFASIVRQACPFLRMKRGARGSNRIVTLARAADSLPGPTHNRYRCAGDSVSFISRDFRSSAPSSSGKWQTTSKRWGRNILSDWSRTDIKRPGLQTHSRRLLTATVIPERSVRQVANMIEEKFLFVEGLCSSKSLDRDFYQECFEN